MKFLAFSSVFSSMLLIAVAMEDSDYRRGLLRNGHQQQLHDGNDNDHPAFDMAAIARDMEHPDMNTAHHIYHDNRRLQQMQFKCPIQHVFAGNCTLNDYCAELNTIDPNTNVTCTGEVTDSWSIVTSFPEACVYSSKGMRSGQPFDTKMYVKGVDVCAAPISRITFSNKDPSLFEKRYRFTRPPYKGVLREFFDLEVCGKTFAGQILHGVCDTCSGAKINGKDCNSCTACAEGDPGKRSIDCSNISPELVNTCDTRGDDISGLVASYLAAKASAGN